MQDKARGQGLIILLGLIIIIIMGLFPPWNYVVDVRAVHFQRHAGYASLFYPPEPPEKYYSIQVDLIRLLIQWALVALAVAAIVLFLRLRSPSKSEVTASVEIKEKGAVSLPPKTTQQRIETEHHFENRILCEDGACTGILDSKGICTECGRSPAQVRAGITKAMMSLYLTANEQKAYHDTGGDTSTGHCKLCRRVRPTRTLSFSENMSFFFVRYHREFYGSVCFSCMSKTFAIYELRTLLCTWWGIIGFVSGPFILVGNLFQYLRGSFYFATGKFEKNATAHPVKIKGKKKEPLRETVQDLLDGLAREEKSLTESPAPTGLSERYGAMETKELIKIVTVCKHQYTAEAIHVAKAELRRRKVSRERLANLLKEAHEEEHPETLDIGLPE